MLTFDPSVGLVGAETVQEKLERWQDSYRSGTYQIDPNFTVVSSPGQTSLTVEQALVGFFAEQFVSLEGALSLLYDQTSKFTAEGRGLDAVLSILNIFRLQPTPTTVQVQVVGSSLASIGGQVVLNEMTQQLFKFPDVYSIPAGGSGSVTLTTLENGPVQIANGDQDWTPNPSNASITSITAIQDSVLGRTEESDEALLVRSLSALGSDSVSTEPAINAAVQAVLGVTSENGEFNRTPNVSASGVPGWHAEVVAEGGSDQDIANAIDERRHATMATFGTITINAASGRPVSFTRPTVEDLEFQYTIVTTGSDFPVTDLDTQNAILSAVNESFVNRVNNTLGVGDDVAPVTFGDLIEAQMPAGSINTYTIEARIPPNAFSTLLVGITKRQRPRLLLANIAGVFA